MLQNGLIFTQNVFLSNLTDMRDGVYLIFTTPSVNLSYLGIPVGTPMVAEFDIPSYTNRSPGSGVGAYTAPTLYVRAQGNGGNPATEANWIDIATLISVGGTAVIRPHIPFGTGAGTTQNPLYSNRAVARFATPFTNYRLIGSYLGSFPDFSAVTGALKLGAMNVLAELQ